MRHFAYHPILRKGPWIALVDNALYGGLTVPGGDNLKTTPFRIVAEADLSETVTAAMIHRGPYTANAPESGVYKPATLILALLRKRENGRGWEWAVLDEAPVRLEPLKRPR